MNNSVSKILIVFLMFLSLGTTAQKTKGVKKISNKPAIDTNSTPEHKKRVAIELYRAELEKPSPKDLNILNDLLAKGANITDASKQGWTLLHEAAYQGDTALIGRCLRGGVPVNAVYLTATSKNTPLYWSIHNNHHDAQQFLTQNGGTLGIADGYGIQQYDSGNKYFGNFLSGDKSGQGAFYYADSSHY